MTHQSIGSSLDQLIPYPSGGVGLPKGDLQEDGVNEEGEGDEKERPAHPGEPVGQPQFHRGNASRSKG